MPSFSLLDHLAYRRTVAVYRQELFDHDVRMARCLFEAAARKRQLTDKLFEAGAAKRRLTAQLIAAREPQRRLTELLVEAARRDGPLP